MSGLVETGPRLPPGRLRFADVVHDFVGEAMLANCDWDHLRDCMGQFDQYRSAPPPGRILNAAEAVRVNDWEYVLWCADSHQGNGPVRCRMLDERLTDLLPNDHYRGRLVQKLARLNALGATWASDVQFVADALDAAGIPWGIFGFPTPYLLYGMSPAQWPRDGGHVEVFAAGEDYVALVDALAPLGMNVVRADLAPEFILPGGTRLAPVCSPEWYGRDLAQRYAEVPETVAGAKVMDLWGVEAPVIRPEVALVLRGVECFIGYQTPAPLTVCELAHVANLTATEGFDWEAVFAYLDPMSKRAERTRDAVGRAAAAVGASGKARMQHATELQTRYRNFSPLAWCLRTWEIADRLYGCFPSGFLGRVRGLLGTGLDPVCWASIEQRDSLPFALVRWARWPGDEAMLFGNYHRVSYADRVADGIWEPLCGGERMPEWTIIPVEYDDGYLPD